MDVGVDGAKCGVDVRLWDTSGDDMYNYYWAIYRDLAQGIVFVYNADNDFETRKLDLLYSYFVNSKGFSHRACLLCCYVADGHANSSNVKLSEFKQMKNAEFVKILFAFQATPFRKFLRLKLI